MTPRELRFVIIGGIVISSLLGVGEGWPRLRERVEVGRDRSWQAQVQLAKVDAAIAARDRIVDSLAVARERFVALAPRLLAGRSPQEAVANLVSLASAAASAPGLRMTAVQSTADSVSGHYFVAVVVRGDLVGDIAGVCDFLHALESGPVSVGLRSLLIEQQEPAAPADRPEQLHVRFALQGLVARARTP